MPRARRYRLRIFPLAAALAVACSSATPPAATPDPTTQVAVPDRAPTLAEPALGAASAGGSTAPPTSVPSTGEPRPATDPPGGLFAETRFSRSGWKTDFSKHTVPLSEIQSGGPPRDGIPPIDRPSFVDTRAAEWLNDREPVVVYEEGGDARAYPLQILIWHEIVNDTVGGRPVTITFCPLCNTAIAFDRRLDGVTYDFGTTGNLRHSDLVMWDRQTESWWQQVTGEAIVGALSGARLTPVPASINSFADFRTTFPNGSVLSRETGPQSRLRPQPVRWLRQRR